MKGMGKRRCNERRWKIFVQGRNCPLQSVCASFFSCIHVCIFVFFFLCSFCVLLRDSMLDLCCRTLILGNFEIRKKNTTIVCSISAGCKKHCLMMKGVRETGGLSIGRWLIRKRCLSCSPFCKLG